jgi:hypothetical protein
MPKNVNDDRRHPDYTTIPLNTPPAETSSYAGYPETYRLPGQNKRDPYWGLSRSWYYEAEKAGFLKLIRLRKRGNMRGVTLVPFRAVAELIRHAAENVE